MEEINLKDLWSYFVGKIGIFIIFILVAVLVSNIYAFWIQTPLYQSSTTIVLTRTTIDSSDSVGITQNDVSLNQKLVSTYSEIIKSRRILNKVINNLELDMKYADLKKLVKVSNAENTEIISITVTHEDSSLAREIADEISDVFSSEIVKIYNIQNISIIDYAEEQENPYNVNVVKQTILAVIVGIVLACALIFVLFYFDTTIKDPDEIEEKLGLIVLGRIPYREKSKGGRK